MTVISLGNNKGGVTKTFSTMQLGAVLNDMGKKVLLIDFDPQGNLSKNLNKKDLEAPSISEVLLGRIDIETAIKTTYREGLDIISSDLRLMEAEDYIKLDNRRSDNRLQRALGPIKEKYDYILIDNSPSISTLFINSLAASNHILIPIECDVNSLEGFQLITQRINQVKEDSNSELNILGIFITKAEEHTSLHREYISEVKEAFDELVFNTIIPKAVVAGDSLFSQQCLVDFNKGHKLTKAYRQLTNELIKRLESLA